MTRSKLTHRLIRALTERQLTLAFAESVTCGEAAFRLATVKGVSEVLRGSVVCYHESAKRDALEVPRALIKRKSAESQAVTDELAKRLHRVLAADVHVAITGLASAGGSETRTKPVGTVFYAVLYRGKLFRERRVYRGSPAQIKTKACLGSYEIVLRVIG